MVTLLHSIAALAWGVAAFAHTAATTSRVASLSAEPRSIEASAASARSHASEGRLETARLSVLQGARVIPDERAPRTQACDTVMTKEALCVCLRRESDEAESAACEMETLLAPNFATMRTPGGNLFAIAKKGKGYYRLTQLHGVGMQTFAVRGVRIRPAATGHVLRIVTFRQEGASDWMHTTNEVVLCAITSPRTPGTGCTRYPLYAHTRVQGFDVPSEQESRFRVQVRGDNVDVRVRSGALQHPELSPVLGSHPLQHGS